MGGWHRNRGNLLNQQQRDAKCRLSAVLLAILLIFPTQAWSADGADLEPILRIDTGGPTSYVTSLAFSQDSQTLYAAGWDKIVRAWSLQANGRYAPNSSRSIRVPIGPRLAGAINAVAVSPDGRTVAIAGRGLIDGETGFRQQGISMLRTGGLSPRMQLDQGVIHLYDTVTREFKTLRGHRGPVLELAFDTNPQNPSTLVSAAFEPVPRTGEKRAAVRLWDVANRKYLRGTFLKVADDELRKPDLAVWRRGPEPTDCRVAVAWNDGMLNVWDTRAGNSPQQYPDASFNNVVLPIPGQNRLLTTGFTNRGGRIRFWSAGNTIRPETNLDVTVASPDRDRFFAPRAVAVHQFATGQLLAAMAVQTVDAKANPVAVELQVYDLASRQRLLRQELWNSTGQAVKRPSIAFSPNGQSLAVAGAADHGIRVFNTGQLLANQAQPDVLLSGSTELRQAHFVRRNEDRGIYFVEAGTKRPLVFDLSRRVIVPFEAGLGWVYDRTKADGWTLQGSGESVTVRSPANKTVNIKANTEALREITSYAILPASKLRPNPILALASQEYGQPTLALHDLSSGEPFRVFYGHTERIEDLSFSRDGRLLLSCGADQTVRVWSLTDIKSILGRHGELMGVAVDDDDDHEGVVIADIEASSPHREQLKAGEHILGVVAQGELEFTDSAKQFYLQMREFAPKRQVTLRVANNGQERDVNVVANQAIDERKPIFSLLVMRGQPKSNTRRWIAWSPAGPFESSDESIEQYLGWHFNTGDPDRPTSFADLNQYRDQYYRTGLLKDLITFGELTARRQIDPIPRPNMNMVIAELGAEPPQVDGRILIQDATQLTLSLGMEFGVSPSAIDSIECSLDDDRLGIMQRVGDLRWALNLSNVDWQRGSHRIVANVRTTEQPAQEFTRQLLVQYQPAAPALSLVSPELVRANHLTVQTEQFELDAQVTPTSGEAARVTLYRRSGKQRESIRTWNVTDPTSLTEAIPLVEGSNEFILEAINADASDSSEWIETSVKSFSITRSVQQRTPIQLAVDIVTSDQQLTAASSDGQLQVRTDGLRIAGSLTGEPDAQLIVTTSQGDDSRTITPTLNRANGILRFSADISDLTMDELTQVSVVAQSNGNPIASWQTNVTYTPPLPTIDFVAPVDRVFFNDSPTQVANIEARLVVPDEIDIPQSVLERIQIEFVVNDENPVPADFDIDEAIVRGQVEIAQGLNRVRAMVRYTNRSPEAGRQSDPILLTLNSPPSLDEVSILPIDGQPRAKLLFTGKTQTDLPAVRVGPYEVSPDDLIYNRETETFEAQVEVPLQDDMTLSPELQVEVRPRGTRRTFAMDIERPTTTTDENSPPELVFVAPEEIDTTAKSEYSIAVEARSKSPFRRLQIFRAGKRLVLVEGANLQQQVKRDGDAFVIQFESVIPLEVGPNELVAVAHNVHSGEKQSATITRVPPLVSVVVDELSTEDRRSIDIAEGKVDSPIANVHGRVIWKDADDPRLKQRMFVKLRINGFQQIAELEPPRGLERPFRIPVLFAEPKNRIDVSLAGVQRDVGDFDPVFVECVKPQGLYRLHVLVVGVGRNVKGDALMDQALGIFRAEKQKANKITTPIYAQGWIYGSLTGSNARYRTFASRLEKINQRILFDRPRDTRVRDVVMLYYTGGELVPEEHTFYLTTRPNQTPESLRRDGISSKMLTDFVESTPGAHVLMLDVSRDCDGQCPRATWPLRSPGAMLRFAWIGVDQKPANLGLLASLNEIEPKSGELGDVDTELRAQETILRRVSNALVYENFVPDALRNLKLRTANASDSEATSPN